LSINPNLKTKKREEWESRVIILKGFAEYTADASEISKGIYKSTEVTTKARITYNPQPEYTEEARKNQVSGVIRIQMILGADGNIYAIIPLNGLPNGLTEKAIKAAKQIKFIPAIKDGQPVSQWVTIEYSFRVY
jgi:TonB family protein